MTEHHRAIVPSARVAGSPKLRVRGAILVLLVPILAVCLATPSHALPPGFADELVTGGIDAPTAIAIAPDGRLFVTEQGGAVRVVKGGFCWRGRSSA